MASIFVYTHHRPDTGEIFYVGIGSKYRSRSVSARNPHWKKIFAKYGRVVNLVAEFATRKDACDMEIFLIWAWREVGAALANYTTGGDGGFERSEETRARMSASLQAACKRESTIAKKAATAATSEYRRRMSASVSAAQARPEVKAKLAAYRKTPEYGRMVAHRNAKPVLRSDGVQFISVNEAARAVGVTDGAIHAVLQGRCDTAAGYGWSRPGEAIVPRIRSDQRKAAVTRSDGTEFDALAAAARSVGVSEGAIRYAIQSGARTAGFGWRLRTQDTVPT